MAESQVCRDFGLTWRGSSGPRLTGSYATKRGHYTKAILDFAHSGTTVLSGLDSEGWLSCDEGENLVQVEECGSASEFGHYSKLATLLVSRERMADG